MIEIDIPSIDPIQHEPKIFMGMTSRQCICVVAGVGLGALAALTLYSISLDLAMIATGLCVIPAIFMGWYTPFNMKCEQYLKLMYFNTFVANSKRIYKTDSEEDPKQLSMKERQEQEKLKKEEDLARKKQKKEKASKSNRKEL